MINVKQDNENIEHLIRIVIIRGADYRNSSTRCIEF